MPRTAPDLTFLRKQCGSTAVERGAKLQAQVIDFKFEPDDLLIGDTRGRFGETFHQEISWSHKKGLHGSCTCNVGFNCQHVVAVILKAGEMPVERPDREIERATTPKPVTDYLDPNAQSWLGNVEKAISDRDRKLIASTTKATVQFAFAEGSGFAGRRFLVVQVQSCRLGPKGSALSAKPFAQHAIVNGTFHKYVTSAEQYVIESLHKLCPHLGESSFEVTGRDSERLLDLVIKTGKAVWGEGNRPITRRGDPRKGTFHWESDDLGFQKIALTCDPPSRVIKGSPVFFVDTEVGEIGFVHTGLGDDVNQALLSAPKISPTSAHQVRNALQKTLPGHPDLLPEDFGAPEAVDEPMTPVLRAEIRSFLQRGDYWRDPMTVRNVPVFLPKFAYGELIVDSNDPKPVHQYRSGNRTLSVTRDFEAEKRAKRKLDVSGLVMASAEIRRAEYSSSRGEIYMVRLAQNSVDTDAVRMQDALSFIKGRMQDLVAEGWRIELDKELQIVEPAKPWRLEVNDESDWFSINLGVEVEGEVVDLQPILLEALRQFYDPISGSLEAPAGEMIFHRLADGRKVPFPVERLKPLVEALWNWFGSELLDGKAVQLPKSRIADLANLDLTRLGDVQYRDPARLKERADKIAATGGLPSLPPPTSLNATLRPYQLDGLAWLQLMREFGFGALLADDMGLGKTIQTIAHILTEKEHGRLDGPVLIVAPTSTIPNWKAEIERFAPSLRVLVARGADRLRAMRDLSKEEIVITTYPLVSRDARVLGPVRYSLIVLDEAQNVKNHKTAAWHAAKSLKAGQKICLSGTPMENNLGELWSLFEFMMPGFLGSWEEFGRKYRLPVESNREPEAARRLAKIVRPYMLRRTKEAVASELPPKTEVLEWVELAGAQRDLYESLRLAMSKRVRDEISRKGLAKSQIIVLDALLKLRQACCDPRLVKTATAKHVKTSAKLDRLMDLIDELRSEDRKALIFSQFTTMLALISERLNERGYQYVTITGDTEDRETPVKEFQHGDVPLFLISLKAGGTGLNLTAAETVIHYDPWWNPAVERQATDRAHRIGQTKPVFVHKLIASNTVEERILEMQARKSDLATALLEGSENTSFSLTQEDIQWIFE